MSSNTVENSVPVLMYHGVEDADLPPGHKHLYVTAREFAGQMRALKRAGYTAITLDTLLAAQAGKASLPPKPLVLTFDDGYANLCRNVHPLLGELGFPYTVYLVSERIGQTSEWDIPEGYVARPLLDWTQIHAMRRDGHAHFHPHSATHPRLARLTTDEARREMRESKDRLEQELGEATPHFCYPFGDQNEITRSLAAELGYASAVTTEFGRVRTDDDPLRLPRVSIYHIPYFSLDYGIAPLNFWWRIRTRKDKRAPHDARVPTSV